MILIDLEICYSCQDCKVKCNYPFHHHKNGFKMLLEESIRKISCRHCQDPPCVLVCPNEALKKEGTELKRSTFLCTCCKSCLVSCPFGVNTIETVEFKVSLCDFCEDREPECVKTCLHQAIKIGEFEEKEDKDIYKIREGLFVKAVSFWKQLGAKR